MKQRILTFLLALLSVSVWGNAWGQSSDSSPRLENDYYILEDADDLKWFRDEVNKGKPNINAKLTNHINLNPGFEFYEDGTYKKSESSTNTKEKPDEWEPIGYINEVNATISYNGHFDGGGHTISGIYIDQDITIIPDNHIGFFRVLGEWSMLGMYIYQKGADAPKIENLTLSGIFNLNLKSHGIYVGGVCSENFGEIEKCKNNIRVNLNYEESKRTDVFYAGICGINNGLVSDCRNNTDFFYKQEGGDITFTLGGISAINLGKIEKCCNYGSIESTRGGNVGGICGMYNDNEKESYVINCYNAASLVGENVAGICNIRSKHPNFNKIEGKIMVKNCHNYAKVQSSAETVSAGLCSVYGMCNEKNDNVEIGNCYYNKGENNTGIIIYEKNDKKEIGLDFSKDEIAFKNGEVLYLLQQEDNDNVWQQTIGKDNYPVFYASGDNSKIYRVSVKYDEKMGKVDGDGFYEENTIVEIKAKPNKNFKFIRWEFDNEQRKDNPLIINQISKDWEIKAIFEPIKYYDIEIDVDNGSVKANKEQAEEGEIVKIIDLKPNDGFEFVEGSLIYTYTLEDNVKNEVIKEKDGVYSFVMPAADVTITAQFKETETPGVPVSYNDLYIIKSEGAKLLSRYDKKRTPDGGSFTLSLEKEEGYEDCEPTVYYKRGRYGEWKELKLDEVSGYYQIRSVYTDIYVKVSGDGIWPVSNEEVGAQEVKVYTQNGAIVVSTPSLMDVQIISMTGSVVAADKVAGQREFRNLAEGVYIVRVGDKIVKVRL